MTVHVEPFFHRDSHTFSYVVHDTATRQAAVIDPVLDHDVDHGTHHSAPTTALLAHVATAGLEVGWLLETHAHADHVSAGRWLKERHFPQAQLAIGEGFRDVQGTFASQHGLDIAADGTPFDRLLADGDGFALGQVQVQVIAVPGHTPDGIAYLIGDALFPGHSLFMPDGGTARCDFPGGDAVQLYRSIQKLLALPAATRVFVCHDYGPGGRAIACQTSIGDQRAHNIHVGGDVTEATFVAARQARDATLASPKLMVPAIRANIQGGGLPTG